MPIRRLRPLTNTIGEKMVIGTIAVIITGLFVLTLYLIYEQQRSNHLPACVDAGGDYVEKVRRQGWQCWNTKTGRRIFLKEPPDG